MTRDYRLAGMAGFLTGICLIPTVWNIGYHQIYILAALPFVGLIGLMFGVWLGQKLSAMIPIMFQLSKFAAVGFLNTAINFGVLNSASILTGITSGLLAGGINVPGTIVAASNSYVWNKLWVFRKPDTQVDKNFFNDVPKFALITFIGLGANSLIIVAFTSYLDPMFGVTKEVWLNIGKFIATVIGVLIDFLGYKFIVFKHQESNVPVASKPAV
jgi:putative flippase GtrA